MYSLLINQIHQEKETCVSNGMSLILPFLSHWVNIGIYFLCQDKINLR